MLKKWQNCCWESCKMKTEIKSFSGGGSVKKIDGNTIKGRGIVFGGKDLYGDTFTKNTDLGESRSFVGMPVYYDHALHTLKSQIGTVKSWSPNDEGIDVEIEIDRRKRYASDVMQLVERGDLGLSTGALSHLVVREEGELKRWVVGEISLTATPAEPRTTLSVKQNRDNERTASSTPFVTGNIGNQKIASKGNTNMTIDREELKNVLKEIAGDPIQGGGVITAPSAKSVTSRGFSDEPMQALKHWIATGDHVAAKATLVEGTNNNGGYLVPKDFYAQIIARRDEMSVLGQFRFMRLTTSRRQIDIPAQDAKASAAIVAESGAANESEPDFANTRTVTIYRHNLMMKISNELLNDQAANLDSFLSESIARAFALNVNNYVINGTGSSQPYGILARISQSETLATTTGVDAQDIINLAHKIPSHYVETGATGWMMRNATLGSIRGLTGNWFSFQPTPAGNGKDLYNFPVALSDSVPAMAASAKSIIFGNYMYYAFVENGGIEISRNPYLYQANNQTAIFADYRWGGDVIQPEAFAYGVNAAS